MAEPAEAITMPSKPPCQTTLSSFLYKALFVFIAITLLPLFPSQAPEFINHSIFNGSWELLHLLIVGIAISYGLFSRRNSDHHDLLHDKDFSNSKPDSPSSYISRLLHVSSIFEEDDSNINNDDNDTLSSSSSSSSPMMISDETSKLQTWSSQYSRNQPVVVKRSTEKSIVLPSPIPWRSRSGRMSMEIKEEEEEENKVPELRAKISEDSILKKRRSNSSVSPAAPPPPPPPPPPLHTPVGKSVRTFRSLNSIVSEQQVKNEVMEKVMVESDDDNDSDGETAGEESGAEEEGTPGSSTMGAVAAEENEVDKKADEFIAKFREQIRLQRIESIKKSSGQRSPKSP